MLVVREHQDGEPSVIARSRWRFAKAGKEGVEANADYAWLEGGFEAGKVYELTYTAIGAPIVGLAFLAYRDAASFLKHGSAAEGNPLAGACDYAYAYGQSMNGRWLREYLYWGLNRDESGRIGFDGMLPNTGSSRRGEFNIRFGQPSTTSCAHPATPTLCVRSDPDRPEQPRFARPLPRRRFRCPKSGHEFAWSMVARRVVAHPSRRRAGSLAAADVRSIPRGRPTRLRRVPLRTTIPTVSSRATAQYARLPPRARSAHVSRPWYEAMFHGEPVPRVDEASAGVSTLEAQSPHSGRLAPHLPPRMDFGEPLAPSWSVPPIDAAVSSRSSMTRTQRPRGFAYDVACAFDLSG